MRLSSDKVLQTQMRARSVSWIIRRAVLMAMVPACGQSSQTVDAGTDASVADVAADVSDADLDAADADVIDDSSSFVIPDIGPPPGCVVTGKPDHFAPCGYTEQLFDAASCLIDPNADGGVEDSNLCYQLCSWNEPDCYFYSLDDAGDYLTCGAGCIGRLHGAARRELDDCCDALAQTDGHVLARAACLEAAAVDAFESLADELRSHGASAALVRAARRAARDETRHARVMATLARSYGTEPRRPTPPKRQTRRLVDLGIENAVEGCVRETYGAALAAWQATQAEDPRVRVALRRIAQDEARHADLGWRIDRWVRSKLSARERERVLRARAAAVRSLRRSIEVNQPRRALGLPDARVARALFDGVASLWA